jgi:hypothetical protein
MDVTAMPMEMAAVPAVPGGGHGGSESDGGEQCRGRDEYRWFLHD